MPKTSDNQMALEDVLAGSSTRAVPFIAVADASVFGRHACENVAKLVPEPWRSVLITAPLAGLPEALVQVESQEFALRPRQLEVWNELPPWLVVFLSDTSSTEEVIAGIENWRQRGLHNVRLLVFFCCSAEQYKSARHPVDRLQKEGAIVCLVSPDTAGMRSVEDLAEGAAVYTTTSWIEYCRSGSGDVKRAMDLPSERTMYSLGVGVHRPDPDFHGPWLATYLAMALRETWLLKGIVPSDQSVFPEHADGLASLLPEDRYAVRNSEDSEDPGLRLRRVDKVVHIKSLASVPERRPDRRANSLAHWFARVRDVRLFDKDLAEEFQRTKPFVTKQIGLLVRQWQSALVAFVKLADSPGSALTDLKERITVAEDRVGGWVHAQADCRAPLSSLEADCALMKRRILSIPSLGGAALRLFLLGVGLAWLAIGPWVFGTGAPLVATAQARFVAASVGVGLGLIFAIAVAECYLMIRWAWRSMDIAFHRCILRHAMQIAGFLKQELAKPFTCQLQQLRDQRQKLHDCEQWLKNERFDFPKAFTNHAPEFDEHTLARIANDHREEAVMTLHNAMRFRFMENASSLYDVTAWQEALMTLAPEHARRLLDQWLYGGWIAAAQLSAEDHCRLVNVVVRLAQQAALAIPPDPNVRVRLVVPVGQRDHWATCLGRNDTVRIESVLATRSLVAVSAIPLHRALW